jgi:hypothetical protein
MCVHDIIKVTWYTHPVYVIYFFLRQNFLLSVEWSWCQQDTGLATVLLVPIRCVWVPTVHVLTVEWSWCQQDTGLATVLLVPIRWVWVPTVHVLTVEWSWCQQNTGLATVLLVPIPATDPVCLVPTVYSSRHCFGRVYGSGQKQNIVGFQVYGQWSRLDIVF